MPIHYLETGSVDPCYNLALEQVGLGADEERTVVDRDRILDSNIDVAHGRGKVQSVTFAIGLLAVLGVRGNESDVTQQVVATVNVAERVLALAGG